MCALCLVAASFSRAAGPQAEPQGLCVLLPGQGQAAESADSGEGAAPHARCAAGSRQQAAGSRQQAAGSRQPESPQVSAAVSQLPVQSAPAGMHHRTCIQPGSRGWQAGKAAMWHLVKVQVQGCQAWQAGQPRQRRAVHSQGVGRTCGQAGRHMEAVVSCQMCRPTSTAVEQRASTARHAAMLPPRSYLWPAAGTPPIEPAGWGTPGAGPAGNQSRRGRQESEPLEGERCRSRQGRAAGSSARRREWWKVRRPRGGAMRRAT